MCKKHLTSDGVLVISLYLPVKKTRVPWAGMCQQINAVCANLCELTG